MPALSVPSDAPRPSIRRAAVADPSYTALRIAAGSLVFLGTESTVSISTLRLAEAARA